MATVTITYSEPDADPETATVLLDGEPVFFIPRGDDETRADLEQFAKHARLVGQAIADELAPEPEG